MALSIGVDVGETFTDAVILKKKTKEVLGSAKVPNTEDVTSGIIEAIKSALKLLPEEFQSSPTKHIERVNIGTTQFANAVVQGKGLTRVALFRLCYPATIAIPPFVPGLDMHFYLKGGYEINGNVITNVDEDQVKKVIKEVYNNGIRNLAIVGVFSYKCKEQENSVRKIIQSVYPDMSITLSHEVDDQIGFLKREAISVQNEQLRQLCQQTETALSKALRKLGLQCPLYFTKMDGTIISSKLAQRFPVLTFASGLTNGMRGAAFLSGVQDAVVIDIGWTTTHVGLIKDGFPKHSLEGTEGADINSPTAFCTQSVQLGGGSIVHQSQDEITVGPESVKQKLTDEALVFGGKVMTATDIAVASGFHDLGNRKNVENISGKVKDKALYVIKQKLEATIDKVKQSNEDQPVVIVGGGGILVNPNNPLKFKGASKIICPPYFQVANAVRAAVSELGNNAEESAPLQEALVVLQLTKLKGEEAVESSEPVIDPVTGDWILKEYDIECITLGAGIMGCGGGGNAYIGKLRAMLTIKNRKEIRVFHPCKLGKVPELTGRVAIAAIIGDPRVVIERLFSGRESSSALKEIETGSCPGEKHQSDKKPVALLCGEMGGISSTEPLAAGGDESLSIVDADGMGRAFPELSMFLPYVYGSPTSFSAIGDEKGNTQTDCPISPAKMDEYFRNVIGNMGELAGIAFTVDWRFVSEKTCALYSLSRLRSLGNTVLQARKSKMSPVDSILEHENGKRLFNGKVVDVSGGSGGGFTEGTVTIEGHRPGSGLTECLIIEVKNENIFAYICKSNDVKEYLATVPDLISLVDELGNAVTTEIVSKGRQVAVVAMPCNPLWTTKKGLAAGGPAAFCHPEVKYNPIGKYKEHPPFPICKIPQCM